jgi:carboxymethylenebutenolidase
MTELRLPHMLFEPEPEPEPGATRAGVIVVHEGYGITPQVIRFCERLAREGYLVVLPDFFFRNGGPDLGDHALMGGAVTREQLRADLATAAEQLRAMGTASIGITGFCMGGSFSYRGAKEADALGIGAAVGFYGSSVADELGELQCPTLLFFGAADPWIPREAAEAVRAHHGDAVVTIYDGAGHGFMRDGSDDYLATAAEDAWARMCGHFSAHLR